MVTTVRQWLDPYTNADGYTRKSAVQVATGTGLPLEDVTLALNAMRTAGEITHRHGYRGIRILFEDQRPKLNGMSGAGHIISRVRPRTRGPAGPVRVRRLPPPQGIGRPSKFYAWLRVQPPGEDGWIPITMDDLSRFDKKPQRGSVGATVASWMNRHPEVDRRYTGPSGNRTLWLRFAQDRPEPIVTPEPTREDVEAVTAELSQPSVSVHLHVTLPSHWTPSEMAEFVRKVRDEA
jgi:hypothetical protein